MRLRLVVRPLAEADLSDIWDYTTGRWSEAQAEAYLAGLQHLFDLLCAMPEIARLRDEFTPSVRLYPYRAHMVIFNSGEETLEVMRVVHARSNWMSLLAEQR